MAEIRSPKLKNALGGLQLAGVLVVLLTISLSVTNPAKPARHNPPGILTPIMAIELVESVSEVIAILDQPGTKVGAEMRDRFVTGNIVDYFYIIAYTAFAILLALVLHFNGNIGVPPLVVMLVFSVSAGVADVLENLQLARIFAATSNEQILAAIPSLQMWTYLKWESLGLTSLVASLGLWAGTRKLVAVLFFLAFVAAFAGLTRRFLIEWQGLLMGVAWMITWYRSLPTRRSWWQ